MVLPSTSRHNKAEPWLRVHRGPAVTIPTAQQSSSHSKIRDGAKSGKAASVDF